VLNHFSKSKKKSAMTLPEIVIALAIMMIVFAAVLPQFNNIYESWAARRSNTDILQNARVLTDHLRRNLSTASRIISVSDPAEINGYLEFENNKGIKCRYELSPSNYVKFGPLESLSDLAGPVSLLQFTCYDNDDLDTPITDVDKIRAVKVQTTVSDSLIQARDQSFNTYVYLQANRSIADLTIVMENSGFEFDIGAGANPALEKIDDTHFLCAYTGLGLDGWAAVLTIDLDAGTITREGAFEFDTKQGQNPALAKIDNEHFVCTYSGQGNKGWAVVLSVDNFTWSISKETPFKFDNISGEVPDLIKIDNSHYLCTYKGFQGKANAAIFAVDLVTWQISRGSPLEFDTSTIGNSALAQIDGSHYLCAYSDAASSGRAVVLTTDTITDTITAGSTFEFTSSGASFPALAQIDANSYLCAYTCMTNNGFARILRVNTDTWQISAPGGSIEYNPSHSFSPVLAEIDQTKVLCAWDGTQNLGVVAVLNVDAATGSIISDQTYEFDLVGETPDLKRIDNTHYIGAYKGDGADGWAILLDINPPLKP
jgi:type II secretory pathway pseudopilin PulG